MAHCSGDEKECKFCYYLHTYFVTVYHASQKVARWLVDAQPPSPSASHLPNARRCWPGSGPQLSRQGVPDEAGCCYSWLTAWRSPTLPPRRAWAVAIPTSGYSGLCRRDWRGCTINHDMIAGLSHCRLGWGSSPTTWRGG